MDQKAIQVFKEKLEDQHEFPGPYLFKFIVPVDKVNEVIELFEDYKDANIAQKESSKGTYKSVTAKVSVKTSDEIIELYIAAKKIEGIISL